MTNEESIQRCIQLIVDNFEGYALARVPHPQYMDREDLQPTHELAGQLLIEIVAILSQVKE